MTSLGDTAPDGLGRVRWRRFALVLVPAIFAPFMLMVLTAQSVLAVTLNISGRPFTVTAQLLRGRGFEQFGVLGQSLELPSKKHPIALAATAMRSATITRLCEAVNIGGVNMIITAGDGKTPVSAKDLIVYADKFSGDASFKQLTLGKDAGSLHGVAGLTGPSGGFSLTANSVIISNLRQHAFSTTAASFTLPGFQLQFGGNC